MRRNKSNQQRGDTIVEVLLAMAVVGMVLGAAYSIANRNLLTAQASKERTDALKIAESQLELMKAGFDSGSLKPNDPSIQSSSGFCVGLDSPTSGIVKTFPVDNTTHCKDQGQYSVEITRPAVDKPYFQILVYWERLATSSSERGEVKLYYSQPVAVVPSTGAILPASTNCSFSRSVYDFGLLAQRQDNFRAMDVYIPTFSNDSNASAATSFPAYNVGSGELKIENNCNYSAEYQVFCKPNLTSLRSEPVECQSTDGDSSNGTQNVEIARVGFYSKYDGGKCDGSLLAYYDTSDIHTTEDSSEPPKSWARSADLSIVREGDVNCIDLRHICSVSGSDPFTRGPGSSPNCQAYNKTTNPGGITKPGSIAMNKFTIIARSR